MLFGYGKKKILLADKSRGFLHITQSLLEDAGYRVKLAKDGQEALGYIEKFRYDLLILGVSLPKIDGIALLRITRGKKKNAKTPALLVYEYANKDVLETRHHEIAGKAQGQIQKPFVSKDFLEKVESVMRIHEHFHAQRM
jgi:CheY-like chemotaxis protein